MGASEGGACPICGGPSMKVIYAALPARFCEDEACACMWGPGSWAADIHFDGVMARYEGGYLRALWRWLFSPSDG